jgi:DNA polymerase
VTPEERRRALEELATEIGRCTNCRLHQSRTQAVPGEGHPESEVVFVGEGPGFNEDQQGRPFVGAAGGLLNELLKSIGWSRQEVFITNVVKCRPPGNRDPEPDEIAACRPFLRRQLEALDPAVLVTLGRISTGALGPLDPESGATDSLAYPMYHPAAAFRQPALRETLQADIAGLPDALLESRRRRAAKAGAIAVDVAPGAVAVDVAPAATPAGNGVEDHGGKELLAEPVESGVAGPGESGANGPVESGLSELVESVPRAGDAQEERDPNQMSLF